MRSTTQISTPIEFRWLRVCRTFLRGVDVASVEYFSDPKTEGEKLLRAVPASLNAISKQCAIAKSQIHYYRRGEKVPDDTTAEVLERHLKIPRGTWRVRLSRENSKTAPLVDENESSDEETGADHDPTASAGSAKEAARAYLKNVRKMRGAAQAQDRSDLPKLLELERRAILDLARFSGELTAADENKLCETRKWIALRDGILDALDAFPDALKAVTEKLAALE